MAPGACSAPAYSRLGKAPRDLRDDAEARRGHSMVLPTLNPCRIEAVP